MKKFIIMTACLLLPSFAPAQTGPHPISRNLAVNGLAAVETELSEKSSTTDEEKFLLGGVHFLRSIEKALQSRWEVGAAPMPDYIPILRVGLPMNPDPKPNRDSLVADIFTEALLGMQAADTALGDIGLESDFGVTVALNDIWFDINMNGKRDLGEGLLALQSMALNTNRVDQSELSEMEQVALPLVRFDLADVAWLRAYTHLISGFSELVLAFDPSDAVAEVRRSQEAAAALNAIPSRWMQYEPESERMLDLFGVHMIALRQQPDPVRTRAAKEHFLAMLDFNRTFWRAVAMETDNEAEWIPNDNQVSALGFNLPEGIGATWQAVLGDAEKLLNGELLIPHWRYGANIGINAAKYLDDPAPIDLLGWLQGMDALPYLENGKQIDNRNWRAFRRLVGRQGLMFALMLN